MLKKIKRTLYDFCGSEALQQIGTKKNKYVLKATIEFSVDKEEEEDNYDEDEQEEEEEDGTPTIVNNML